MRFINELFHYTEQRINQLSTFTDDLKGYSNELTNKLVTLKSDVQMIEKYLSFKYKIKQFFFSLLQVGKK